MDWLNDIIKDIPFIKPALYVAGFLLLTKIVFELLKVGNVMNLKNRSPFDAFISVFFKKYHYLRQAKKALKTGNYGKAGEIYEHVGLIREAIRIYEDNGDHTRIGSIYERMRRFDQALSCYQQGGDIESQLRLLVKLKRTEDAAFLLENNNRQNEAAELYLTINRHEKAGQIYERRGLYQKAAQIFEQAGNLRRAAYNHERWFLSNSDTSVSYQTRSSNDTHLLKAAELYERAEDTEKALELLLQFSKHTEAAALCQRLGRTQQAAELYEKAHNLPKAAELYGELGQNKRAALLWGEAALNANKSTEAAEWFLKGEDYPRAAELFEWNSNFEQAAHCYFLNQNYMAAADNYLKVKLEGEAAKMFELGQSWGMAADLYFKSQLYEKAGELYEKAGNAMKAGLSFLEIQDTRRALANFQQVKSDDPGFREAVAHMARIFLKNRKPQLVIEKLGKLLQNSPINKTNLDWYYVLGEAYENAGHFTKAFEIFQGILAEDYSYRDIHEKIQQVEELIRKYKEMQLVSDDSSQRYKMLQKVGEGGMGVVFKAEDTVLKRIVAMKILNANLIKDKRSLERFYSEARSTASLSHANIVTVYDVGQIQNDHFISMEFIEGENFMTLIRQGKNFSIPQILFIAIKILKALDYSHRKGIVHRDIKPHNVMITRQKEIKIMDFGLAIIRDDQQNKSESGVITGTPYYMSPEQIQGVPTDHRTDIYSTGATLFHLITGRVPFKGENVFYQHLFDEVPSLIELRADCPLPLEAIVHKCMAKKREDRFQSAQDVLAAMKSVRPQED